MTKQSLLNFLNYRREPLLMYPIKINACTKEHTHTGGVLTFQCMRTFSLVEQITWGRYKFGCSIKRRYSVRCIVESIIKE